MAQSKKTSKPIQDVAHPNTSAADATAKPILITNRPIVADPMVKTEENDLIEETPKKDKKNEILKHDLVVEPPSAPEIPGAEPVEEDKKETIEEEKPKEDKTEEPEPTKEPVPETSEADDKKEEKPVEEEAEQDKSPDDKDQKENEPDKTDSKETKEPTAPEEDEAEKKKQAEHEQAIENLVESKKYYLPINTIEKRRSKKHVVLGVLLSLVLIVAWADIALDSGILNLHTKLPHTNFFSQVSTTSTTSTTPAAPKVTFSKYTFADSGLSIKYPGNWATNNSGNSFADQASITPPSSSPGSSKIAGAITISYSSNKSQPTSTGNYTVKSVAYKQLPKATANPVYLRDIVYLDNTDNTINVSSSLTNSKSIKQGDTLKSLSDNFAYANSSVNNFIVTVDKQSSSSKGFKTTALASNYMTSTQYLQARSILFSLSN